MLLQLISQITPIYISYTNLYCIQFLLVSALFVKCFSADKTLARVKKILT